MIKLLITILLGLIFAFFAYSMLKGDDSSIKIPGSETEISNPSDAIEGAKDAVDQGNNLQNQLNQNAQDQLYQ